MINVFLSYARGEPLFSDNVTTFVNKLATSLAEIDQNNDYSIFFDQDGIYSAEDWRLRVLKEAEQSHIILLSGTQEWYKSQWCARELLVFARAGRRSKQDLLPVGRALLPLTTDVIDFAQVPWQRRFNARYASQLVQTRQLPKTTQSRPRSRTTLDAAAVSREIASVASMLDTLSPIRLPGLLERWRFLPIGLKLIAAAILIMAIGIGTFLVRNWLVDQRELVAKQGVFASTVRAQQGHAQDMHIGLSTLSPSGLPSNLPTLESRHAERFNLKWSAATRDLERYFEPLASCIEDSTCAPNGHEELCSIAQRAMDGYLQIHRFFDTGGGDRGFTYVINGSQPIIDMGGTIHQPPFQHTPTFYMLVCN